MSFKHLMIDIETLGNNGRSVICSIAAVPFNLETGETGTPFIENISIKSCLDAGLLIEADTLIWWAAQERHLLIDALNGQTHISEALYRLSCYIHMLDDKVQLWSNGSGFDLALLADAYKAVGHQLPWHFSRERDVRTLLMLAPETKSEVEPIKNAHDPVEDCFFQIRYCCAIYKKIQICK